MAASRTGIGYATRELMLVATCSMAVESVARRIAGGALAAAFRFVAGEGYQNASVLAEGFRGWVKRGYPVEPR